MLIRSMTAVVGPLFTCVILATAAPPARAQTSIGHASIAPVAVQGIGIRRFAVQLGAGGEVTNGIVGLGGDVDVIFFPEVNRTFAGGHGGASSPAATLASFSFYGSYYFPRDPDVSRVQPFVRGGLGFFVGTEPLPALNLSAGVDWWSSPKMGLRTEVQMQMPIGFAFRCGVVFK